MIAVSFPLSNNASSSRRLFGNISWYFTSANVAQRPSEANGERTIGVISLLHSSTTGQNSFWDNERVNGS